LYHPGAQVFKGKLNKKNHKNI